MTGSGNDLSAMSMMDLFCQEAENHCTTLSENLLALEKNPHSSEALEALMRAAHSIKGAARIMDLQIIVNLGHVMEDIFIAAQEDRLEVGSVTIDLLLQGVDKIGEIGQAQDIEISDWFAAEQTVIERLTDELARLVQGNKVPAVPRDQPYPHTESVAEPIDNAEDSIDLESMSMMELFRQEVETHCSTLSDNLLGLEKDPESTDALEELMRAAHSIKGAARILDLQNIVTLIHAMEEVFVAARNKSLTLERGTIDLLLNGVDTIAELGHIPNDEVNNWLSQKQAVFIELIDRISQLVTGNPELDPAQVENIPSIDTTSEPIERKEESTDLSSIPMVDLFRQEVESNCSTLSEHLLILEKNSTSSEALEELMRAAHSIKGAARVIELHRIVGLAHTMEDVFVAAQEGKIDLSHDDIDVLLAGVDVLASLAGQPTSQFDSWFVEQEKQLKELERIYKGISVGELSAREAVATTQERPKQVQIKKKVITKVEKTKPADRSMRVSAEGMNRLMGYAGEVQVESRWLPSFSQKVLRFKHQQDEIHRLLTRSVESVGTGPQDVHLGDLRKITEKMETCRNQIADILEEIEDHARRSTEISHHLYEEVLANRMRPFSDGISGFPRMVRDVARELGKNIEFRIIGEETLVDRDILDRVEAPLNHLIRNAIDHGIEFPQQRLEVGKPETALITLEARHNAGMLSIMVKDDGCGIDVEKLRNTVIAKKMINEKTAQQLSEPELLEFIFLPNFSTRDEVSQVSGRGVGLDVVHSAVQEVRGVIRTSTEQGLGTSFELQLPLTLSVMRSLLVDISDELYAFPLAAIDHVIRLGANEVREIEGRQYITFNQERVGLVYANQVLEKEGRKEKADGQDELLVLMLSNRYNRYGLIVDAFIEIRDLVVQPLDPRLKKVQDISSVAILEDGTPVLIVDVEDMARTIDSLITGNRLRRIGGEELFFERRVKRILVVDDSITVREVERKMLSLKGYDVITAVDGLDGWNILRGEEFDLVVTDVDMPRMNGIELVKLMREDENYSALPVIIVSYKDRKEDRNLGLEAGADYYLTKGSFQDETLTRAVEDLIGVPSK